MLVSLVVLTKVTSQLVHGGCRLVHVSCSHKVQRIHLPVNSRVAPSPPLGRVH